MFLTVEQLPKNLIENSFDLLLPRGLDLILLGVLLWSNLVAGSVLLFILALIRSHQGCPNLLWKISLKLSCASWAQLDHRLVYLASGQPIDCCIFKILIVKRLQDSVLVLNGRLSLRFSIVIDLRGIHYKLFFAFPCFKSFLLIRKVRVHSCRTFSILIYNEEVRTRG